MATTRRDFLKTTGLASAGLAVGGTTLNAKSMSRISGAGDKINLACIGIGYQGGNDINSLYNTGYCNIVALCDIDLGASHTRASMDKFPEAKQFTDFRVMFDKMANEIDAVLVAIPDFAHYCAAIHAISLGKHVYVEKPLCRTFNEAELLMKAAREHPDVVTQMGNQGHSGENYFQFKAWKEAGIIKDVTAVTAHMNSSRRWHPWDSRIFKYPAPQPIPAGCDWDTWNMSNWYHEFNEKYHPGNWRSWFDLGMGALGDWGAHLLDTVHQFLELGLPYEIDPVMLKQHNDYFFPMSSTLKFKFAARGKMPACDITWYDGIDNLPPLPKGYGGAAAVDSDIPFSGGAAEGMTEAQKKQMKAKMTQEKRKLNPGKIIYSKTLTFKGGSHSSPLTIIPEEKARAMAKKLPEVPKSPSNHYANFLLACLGKEKARSPFEIAAPLSEVFCLGVAAQRFNTKLLFDTTTKQITNNKFANAYLVGTPPRKGWEDYYKI